MLAKIAGWFSFIGYISTRLREGNSLTGIRLLLGMGFGFLAAFGSVVYADIGPKPSLSFEFRFEGEPVPISSVDLFHCDDTVCADRHRSSDELGLLVIRPVCDDPLDQCMFYPWGDSPYWILTISLEDQELTSNVFTKTAFGAVYDVVIGDNTLTVVENRGAGGYVLHFASALLATLVVETILAGGYLHFQSLPKKVLRWVFLANIISVPILYILAALGFDVILSIRLSIGTLTYIAVLELVVIIFEAEFVYRIGRQTLSRRQAWALSLIINMGSILFGLVTLALGWWI